MNVSFRQIRLFLALAETGSVTAAAKATHITQPTASMRLKELLQKVMFMLVFTLMILLMMPLLKHAQIQMQMASRISSI